MTELRIPNVAESITEVTLSKFLVKDGDYVQLDQPICRGDDPLCGSLRSAVSTAPHGATLGSRLLALPLSQYYGPVASVQVAAHLGRLCGLDLRVGFDTLLVCRLDS